MTSKSILVIGGGLAGLQAASSLTKQGYDVELLEAKGRLGGRVWTHTTPSSQAVEIGGNWIHNDASNHPVRKLLEKVHGSAVESFLTPSNEEGYVRSSRVHKEGSHSHSFYTKEGWVGFLAYTTYYKLIEKGEEEGSQPLSIDETIDEALTSYKMDWWASQETREQVKSILTLMLSDGAPAKESPAYYRSGGIDHDLYFLDRDSGAGRGLGPDDHDFFVSGGVDKILTPLKEGVKYTLNAQVLQVAHKGSGMHVTYQVNGEEKEWHGDRVVCTLPLGVLQKGSVTFQPPLSQAKQAAIQSLKMKNHRKLIFTFDQKAFQAAGIQESSLAFFDQKPARLVLNVDQISKSSGKSPSLIVWLSGDQANQMDLQHPEGSIALKEEMLAMIQKYYPTLNAESLVDYVDKPWGQDPYTHGSYSYVPDAGGYRHMYEMFRPEYKNKLFFAGEHTSPVHEATMHGALLSGERAVFQVNQSYR